MCNVLMIEWGMIALRVFDRLLYEYNAIKLERDG